MTFEEFNCKAHGILGDSYVFYPPYKNMKTPIKYKHLVCNTEGTLIPSNIISGHAGCKYCAKLKRAKERAVTEEEFKHRLHQVRPNDDIVLLEPLHGLFKKTKAKCLVCNYGSKGEWEPLPINLLAGKGCPNCAGNAPKTSQALQLEVQTLGNGEYEILGTKRTKKEGLWLHLYHKVCKNDYWVRNDVFISGCRCKYCQNKKNGDRCRLSMQELRKRITKIADHQYRYIGGSYKNNQSLIKVKHLVCETEYYTTWGRLSSNKSLCPRCNATNGEQEVMGYLIKCKQSYSYGYQIPDLEDINRLHFDFWLPQYQVAIEYDGMQHYKPVQFGGISLDEATNNFTVGKKHDQMKDNYCKEHNIKLIRIPYYEKVEQVLDQELLPLFN